MKQIFLIGAGRSSSSLINYLLNHADQCDWELVVGDSSMELGKAKIKNHPRAQAIKFNVFDQTSLDNQVEQADLVISMLPANLHHYVAEACLKYKKSLLTASYVSEEIQKMHDVAKEEGVMILMEAGLDPGIDHMSAKKEIDEIKSQGGKILSFKSFTGGLVAPESDNNPWHYKFTWNPRNVVLAGQGTVKFLRNGHYKYIPYTSLFKRLEAVEVKGYGEFEGYANRNSLKYIDLYELKDVPTIFRGTLRRTGFCDAWNVFVLLGMTDDTYQMEEVDQMTWRDYINSFLVYDKYKSVEDKLAQFLGIPVTHPTMEMMKWLGLFTNESVGLNKGTPAYILQHLLESKWQLNPEDKDMIVMQHQFEYELGGRYKSKVVSMVVKGDNAENTSMAKTVGLPLAIAAKLFLTGKLNQKGVLIPVVKELYAPILSELEEYGVEFVEE